MTCKTEDIEKATALFGCEFLAVATPMRRSPKDLATEKYPVGQIGTVVKQLPGERGVVTIAKFQYLGREEWGRIEE